jgi:hypothetical protein
MKKIFFIWIFFTLLSKLHSQNPYGCYLCNDEICYIPEGMERDSLLRSTKREFVSNYITKFYKNIYRYIDYDNKGLFKLSNSIRFENKVCFVLKIDDSDIEIIVDKKLEKKTIINPKYLRMKKKSSRIDFRHRNDYLKEDFIIDSTIRYGATDITPETQYNFINTVRLIIKNDTINVPSCLINDFVSPNFLNQWNGYAPIQAYYNKNKDYYAIYIYEDPHTEQGPYCIKFNNAYLIKIIIDPKKKIVDRFAITSKYLIPYGICSCPDFWIF